MSKIEAAKNKNRELAQELLKTAGSADRAIASLQQAKKFKGLGEFGIDQRQVGGIIKAIRDIDKEAKNAGGSVEDMAKRLNAAGQRANAVGDITESFGAFARGDFLKGIEKWKKGLADLQGEGVKLGAGLRAALYLTANDMVGKGLATAVEKAQALQKELQDGSITAQEYAIKLAQIAPVIGGWVTAGRGIREMLTGQDAEANRYLQTMNAVVDAHKRLDDAIASNKKRFEDQRQAQKEYAEETRAQAIDAAGKANQARDTRLRNQANTDLRNQTNAIEAGAAADLTPLKAEADRLRKLKADADKSVSEMQTTLDEAMAGPGASRGRVNLIGAAEYRRQLSDAKKQAADLKKELDANANAQFDVRMRANRAIEQADKNVQGRLQQNLKAAFGDKSPAQKDLEDNAKRMGKQFAEYITPKVKPLTDWLDKQIKDGQRRLAQMKQQADRIRESLKTPAELMQERLGEAVDLHKQGLLSQSELDAFFTDQAKELLDQRKGLGAERSVYQLPQVRELRAGQNLVVPPTKVDEAQLERLREIENQLRTLNDTAKSAGVVIEELSG